MGKTTHFFYNVSYKQVRETFLSFLVNHILKYIFGKSVKTLTLTLLVLVVQSIVSFASSLMVKMLTALVSTISNSHVVLLKKM